MVKMTVRAATERDLKRLPSDLAESAWAASALQAADRLDDPATRPTAFAAVLREHRETMEKLRVLAPPRTEKDRLDDLSARRAKRRRRATATG